ncbi:NCS2 family permease [Corticibacter populi]|uniref:NCS2 family permease n=1 Tax=Corticibacter populi TaxID=1550736 RepID=A0A3M6QMA7_9BURK|nr:NCS2 family permease [Corticibacter populi]RMX04218.1 NCS2 family permease [Corticibacter populi]RZS33251.1 AGZA family xanthine/uracil permease-like MFS transporter [Corticibacter populi]
MPEISNPASTPAGTAPPQTGLHGWLERRFHLHERGTNVRTEVIAGITTFLTMAYIIFVNPQILGQAGMDGGAVFVATCLAAAISTLIMALWANYPIALAPGMGLNAFFTFTVVLTYQYSWQEALGCVLASGVLFVLLSLLKVREAIINAFPRPLKMATSAGIGLFLGIIALQSGGLVVQHPATLVTLGDLSSTPVVLMIVAFIAITVLNHRRVLGGTLIGIIGISIIGLPLGLTQFHGLVSMPPSLAPTWLALDLSRAVELSFWVVVFTMLFVDLFDTAGTLIGVSHRAGLLDSQGNLPGMKRALLADSSATVVGAMLGTSNTGSYVESAAGTAVGGRTGLVGVVVALCFLAALFLSPLASMIPQYATAAALLYVACVMARGLTEMNWDDTTEYVPGVICALAMPLTYSIAAGIGLGIISYVGIKLASGRFKDVSWTLCALALAFMVFFAVN